MVEWKKLGDIASVSNGERPTSDILEVGMYPYINAGRTNSGYLNDFNSKSGAITTPSHGEGGIGCVLFQYHDFWCGALCYKMYTTKGVEGRYLYHYLSNNTEKIINCKNVGGQPYINRKQLENIVIGVPSLSEQQRIVGILDTFTASIDNLKEQIAQRRKQYEYYRDQLLDLEGKEGVKRITLKDICEVINGRAYSQPELLNEGKYRVLRVGNFFSNDKWYYSDLELDDKYYCISGDLLYAWSASFGPHIWEEEKTIYHYHIWKMNCSEKLTIKYMYYWLQSNDMRKQAFVNLHGATMAHLTKVLMESLMVPVPSLSEQHRIVSILDTFESSIRNLESQLSQREKQYEYYRNKLLTFE